MVLEFLGNCPKQKYIRVGVMANNYVDDIMFLLSNKQGGITLTDFTPYIKMRNKDLSFVDKTQIIVDTSDPTKVKINYTMSNKVTRQKNVDMQLSFERHSNDGNNVVWQTQIFNITFENSIDVSKVVENNYPDVLQDIDTRLTRVEEAMPTVAQYTDKYYFPNVGVENAVYIDARENKAYRYDIVNNNYYVVGSDYEEIKTINANGG